MKLLRIIGDVLFGCVISITKQGVQHMELEYRRYQHLHERSLNEGQWEDRKQWSLGPG
jgi:hypothetical protein